MMRNWIVGLASATAGGATNLAGGRSILLLFAFLLSCFVPADAQRITYELQIDPERSIIHTWGGLGGGGIGDLDISGSFKLTLDPGPFHASADTGAVILWPNCRVADGVSYQFELTANVIGPPLQAGDANQDQSFDQQDIVRVLQGSKYLTGEPATWGEGDWNAGPGGYPGSPPPGDGLIDQNDIVSALQTGAYLNGPYAAILPGGVEGDEQTSIIYDARTGEIAVDAPASTEWSAISIDSEAGIFTGDDASLYGWCGFAGCHDPTHNISKVTFGSSYGSLSLGNVAETGLSEDFVANDLTVFGSLAVGGGLGDVDLIYIPEPSTSLLALLICFGLLTFARRQPW